jgi:hypothetical protein
LYKRQDLVREAMPKASPCPEWRCGLKGGR